MTNQTNPRPTWRVSQARLEALIHGLGWPVFPSTARTVAVVLADMGWPTEFVASSDGCTTPDWAMELLEQIADFPFHFPENWDCLETLGLYGDIDVPLDILNRVLCITTIRTGAQPTSAALR